MRSNSPTPVGLDIVRNGFLLILALLAMVVFFIDPAIAHPEDDFCGPDSGIDPALCRQLAALNSSEGSVSSPLVDDEGNVLTPLQAATLFFKTGIEHILPGGLDHILFVFALFLAANSMRSLVFLISIFTVAHTATLGLTAAGVIEPPAWIVEPLIALSIAFVAIETLFRKGSSKWRPLVVFGFGLFHGMGFAGFVREIGLPEEQFWPSLLGFNVGVEVGQLAVIVAAVLVNVPIKLMLSKTNLSYRQVVILPCSLLISAVGIWWFVTRSFGM